LKVLERIAITLLLIGIAAVVLMHGVLYVAQDSIIFMRRPLDDGMRATLFKAYPDAREVHLATRTGPKLHGWFLRNSDAQAAPVLIYFGGNAEEVTGFALDAAELAGVSLALFNYRGYGASGGTPSEAALYEDALAIYDFVASQPGVDPKRIIAMGRSLGSGVATYLAAQRQVSAVVLVTPYDSLGAVAQAAYPYVLVGPLLRHPFDSLARAPRIEAPMLALVAANDTVIPPAHAGRLVAAWKGPASAVVLDRAGHNDVHGHPNYWRSLRGFLAKQGLAVREPTPIRH
jgi:uncharacterized protein